MDLDGVAPPEVALQGSVPVVPASDRVSQAQGAGRSSPLTGPAPATLQPTIDDVLQYPVSAIRHLLNAAIRPVAVLLEALIQDLVADPS